MQNQVELNQQFGLKGQLQFSQEESGFIMVDISNQYAKARVSTYAGHVTSFLPNDSTEDVLFLSDKVIYQEGKAIRGGMPICWPWFGEETSGAGLPAHGFARNQPWTVLASSTLDDGRTSITLGLSDTESSRTVWPYAFKLELEVIVGKALEVNLTTTNTGNQPFSITQAIHTYFNISDAANVSIKGLDGIHYLDKLEGFNSHLQSGDVMINEEVDRVFQDGPDRVVLTDSGYERTINIDSTGSNTTVIWNPWATSISKFSDLDNTSYQQFVCVEAANAAEDMKTIEAGKQHTITAIYEIV